MTKERPGLKENLGSHPATIVDDHSKEERKRGTWAMNKPTLGSNPLQAPSSHILALVREEGD